MPQYAEFSEDIDYSTLLKEIEFHHNHDTNSHLITFMEDGHLIDIRSYTNLLEMLKTEYEERIVDILRDNEIREYTHDRLLRTLISWAYRYDNNMTGYVIHYNGPWFEDQIVTALSSDDNNSNQTTIAHLLDNSVILWQKNYWPTLEIVE